MMVKKIILGTLGTIVLLLALAALYLYSLTVERPDENYDVLSTLHNSEFASSARSAEARLQSLYEAHQIPSLSVAVGVRGELAWTGAIGYADLESAVRADSDTRYIIGSISKSMTATAAMRMSEKGLLDIDKPYRHYVDDFPSETPYTLKHLLSHQAGIRHYNTNFAENFSTKEYATTREAAMIVGHDELLFTPGDDFHYSTYGYTLLALAVESAYGLSFEEVMATEVFSPIGMSSTVFDKVDQSKADQLAARYMLVSDTVFAAPEVNVSYKYAGGGYLSTPSDVVRFGNALLGSEFLTSQSVDRLWTPVLMRNGAMAPQNYALGFRVGEDELGRFVHHGGMSVGGYSFLIIYPDSGVVVALSTNTTPMGRVFDRYDEAKKIARMFIP